MYAFMHLLWYLHRMWICIIPENIRWNGLEEQGFEVVEYRMVTGENLDEAMDYFAHAIEKNDFPSDGLVALI